VDALLRGGCRGPRTTGPLNFVLSRPVVLDDEVAVAVQSCTWRSTRVHRVLRQFGCYQEGSVPVVHTVLSAHHR
jgi:hypothetical protein